MSEGPPGAKYRTPLLRVEDLRWLLSPSPVLTGWPSKTPSEAAGLVTQLPSTTAIVHGQESSPPGQRAGRSHARAVAELSGRVLSSATVRGSRISEGSCNQFNCAR